MKKRYTNEQIIKAIKRHKAGVKVDEASCDEVISVGTCKNNPHIP